MGKSVQHEEIYLPSNFHFNLFSHVGVIALIQRFLLFLMLFLSKIFSSETILSIEAKLSMSVPWGILHRYEVGFLIRLKTWLLLLKIEQSGQTVVFRIYLQNR